MIYLKDVSVNMSTNSLNEIELKLVSTDVNDISYFISMINYNVNDFLKDNLKKSEIHKIEEVREVKTNKEVKSAIEGLEVE